MLNENFREKMLLERGGWVIREHLMKDLSLNLKEKIELSEAHDVWITTR